MVNKDFGLFFMCITKRLLDICSAVLYLWICPKPIAHSLILVIGISNS